MNGTLLVRAKTRKAFGSARKPDLKVGDRFYFFRPGAKELVGMLSTHPSIDFAFYTSMRMNNALPAARLLDQEGVSFVPRWNLFDQTYNHFSKDDPQHSWGGFRRNLPKVWKSGIAKGHNEMSTVTIDDTPVKMKEFHRNVIVVDEYIAPCDRQSPSDTPAAPRAAEDVEGSDEDDEEHEACHKIALGSEEENEFNINDALGPVLMQLAECFAELDGCGDVRDMMDLVGVRRD